MISASVNAFDFDGYALALGAELDRISIEAINLALEEGEAVAQANASIDLKLERIPAHPDASIEGYAGGLKSHARTSVKGRTTPIATFFDKGTLGNRRGKLKRGRKATWTQRNPRGSETHTAHRLDVDGKGIPAERFLSKAGTAGRRLMREHVEREL